VLFVIVATGNHFLIDAAAGAAVSVVALLGALLLVRPLFSAGLAQADVRVWAATSNARLTAEVEQRAA
jgi:hypothetical protein